MGKIGEKAILCYTVLKEGLVMKKVLLFLICLFLVGCSDGNTVTEQPRNHLYGLGEEIVVTSVDNGNQLMRLQVKSVKVLKNEKFSVQSETDEKTSTEYSQLIEIEYDYVNINGNSKILTSSNFTVYDELNEKGLVNPNINYQEQSGSKSFTVALKNSSDKIKIDFCYDLLQFKPTAKIEVNTNAESEKELTTTTTDKSFDNTSNISKENKKTVDKTAKSNYIIFVFMAWIIFILLFSTITLSILLYKKTKKNVS